MPGAAPPTGLRFEHHPGPALGVGHARPRLSWHVPEAEPGFRQRAYEVELTRGAGDARRFEVESGEQVLVPWPGPPLVSRERVLVRVRVRDDDWTAWSDQTSVEAGLLHADDWTARLISPRTAGGLDAPAPVLRGELTIPGDVVSARFHATAHGVYAAELNGGPVGDHVLAPGWTGYDHRLRYQTHDVTDLVRPGVNVVEVLLGNGWFRGRLGFRGGRATYGDRLALLAQLEVTTRDGAVHVLATEGSWTARDSGVVADDLYDGQRTVLRDVDAPAGPVDVLDGRLERLVAPDGPPVRVTDVLPALGVRPSPSGGVLVDFGQNVVGRVRLLVADRVVEDEVVVRHAEVLEHGDLAVRPLRTARATDTYLSPNGHAVLEPALTFHGFRYAEVTGVRDLRAGDVRAVVVGTDLRRTGWFDCSNDLLTRLHDNVVWSARGNFLDVPTDCPQRDERLGWTGDIQVFAPTACFLFDSTGFLTSWLADLAVDQHEDGSVPFVVPDVLPGAPRSAAAWADAAVLVPWVVHQRTGDLGSSDGGKVSLTFLVDNSDASVKPAEGLAKAFGEKNPDVEVKVEVRPQGGEGDNVVKTRLSTGDMTDVFLYNSGSLLQALKPAETLVSLKGEKFLDNVQDAFFPTVSSGDDVFGVPIGGAMGGGVLYNRAVYERLGLQVPKTWAEFMANNAKIKAAGIAPVIQTYQDTWTSQVPVLADFHNVAAAEPRFADDYTANKTSYAKSSAALKGFQRLQDVHDAGYLNEDFASAKYEVGLRHLAAGEGVHFPILTFVVGTLVANHPDQADDVGFFALPGDDAAKNGLTVWTPAGVYVPKTTQGAKLDAAKRFLGFIASREGCEAQTKAYAPTGPYVVEDCPLPDDLPRAVRDMLPYFAATGGTTPALEFVSPIKGPALEQITVEVGSGIRSAADGAALYDRDVEKQAKQLGLPGW